MSHLILDICELETLPQCEELMSELDDFCILEGITVFNRHHHVFGEEDAYTILYLLSESHLSVHTFPEKGTVAIDLYTCRPQSCDVCIRAFQFLCDKFQGKVKRSMIIERVCI